jgi:hypothetical protein
MVQSEKNDATAAMAKNLPGANENAKIGIYERMPT